MTQEPQKHRRYEFTEGVMLVVLAVLAIVLLVVLVTETVNFPTNAAAVFHRAL